MIIKIPSEHYISPVDGSRCKFDTDRKKIVDAQGVEWSLDHLKGTRKLDAARKYLEGYCV